MQSIRRKNFKRFSISLLPKSINIKEGNYYQFWLVNDHLVDALVAAGKSKHIKVTVICTSSVYTSVLSQTPRAPIRLLFFALSSIIVWRLSS